MLKFCQGFVLMAPLVFVSGESLAFLPDEQAPPAVSAKPMKSPHKAREIKPRPARKKIPQPHHEHEPTASEDWCQEKGGSFDEEGNCVRNLTTEECANLGGALDEAGTCIANQKICEEKGGYMDDHGDCIFHGAVKSNKPATPEEPPAAPPQNVPPAPKKACVDKTGENCAKKTKAEECSDQGGALDEHGVCVADQGVCEKKGGRFTELGECVF